MSESERRKALNEALFREVNERINELQPKLVGADEPLQIVCECDRLDCAEPISVGVDIYEKVRSDSALFFILPGHEDDAVEEVVDTRGDYMIVRKRVGDPQRIAEQTDPRS